MNITAAFTGITATRVERQLLVQQSRPCSRFRNQEGPATTHPLNQPGGKVGGPIIIPELFNGQDKAFFFVNYEEYRLPEKSPDTGETF